MKKILFLLVLLVAMPLFAAVNITAKQGETVVVTLPPEDYQGKNVTLEVFGNSYRPNEKGIIYIGIDVRQKPGTYKVALCEDRTQPRPYGQIVVKKGKYNIRRAVTKVYIDPDREDETAEFASLLKTCSRDISLALDFTEPLEKIIITGQFGRIRPHVLVYSSGRKVRSDDPHKGVDLRARHSPVYSVNEGVVISVKNLSREGNAVVVCHDGDSNVCSIYFHLASVNVKKGDPVARGTEIGISGNSGNNGEGFAPHLHFAITINGAYVDPLAAMKVMNKHLK